MKHCFPIFSLLMFAIPLIGSAGEEERIDWSRQAAEDAKHDRTTLVFEGLSPNRLACDTTLREMPDGSWVVIMLGGGHKEPLPANRVWISRSADEGKTWSTMQPVDLGVKNQDPNRALVPTELMVQGSRVTLFVSTHDGHFGDWKTWLAQSDDSCRSFGRLIPAPGKLKDRTFIRNHIVTRDKRILLPFQHNVDAPGPRNPRNGVMISKDEGRTWSVHGWIRTSTDDNYRAWAENNIVELGDGQLAMLIRTKHGVLYRADSDDGGQTWPKLAEPTEIPNPSSKATLYSLGGNRIALLHNPHPRHRSPLSLWISADGMRTWPYRRVLVAKSVDAGGKLNYPDGFVSRDGEYLHFAFDDNRHRAVYVGAKLPPGEPK